MPDLIGSAASRAGVPRRLLESLVGAESGGRADALSPAGARGLAQLMPGTAAALERRYGIDTSTPQGNLLGGAYYLREQLDRFKTVPLALAAYNAGPGAVQKYGGIPPYAETQGYVSRIMRDLGGNTAGATAAQPSTLTREFAASPAPAQPSSDSRAAFASGLIGAIRGGKIDPQALLGLVQARRAAQTPQLAAAPGQVTPSAPVAPSQANQPASGPLPQGLDPAFSSALDRLLAAVPGLTVTSGYRTPEHQAELYAAALKKYGSEAEARKWVAPPGRSRHNMGLAADLAGPLDQAHSLAAQFGLVFPLGNERWHVEARGAR